MRLLAIPWRSPAWCWRSARRPHCRALAGLKRAPAHDRSNPSSRLRLSNRRDPAGPGARLNALQVFLLVGIGAAGWALLDFYRQRREPIVRVNGLPIARQLITSDDDRELIGILAERIRLAGIAQIEEARRPFVPASLSYSPKLLPLTPSSPPRLRSPCWSIARPTW